MTNSEKSNYFRKIVIQFVFLFNYLSVKKQKKLFFTATAVKLDKFIKIYFQVSNSIMDKKVEEREKKSLLAINDNYRKVILTMDNVKNKQIDGIEVVNIIDFLTEE